MYVYVCINVCIYVRLYVCMHVLVFVCMCMHVLVYVCVYICTNAHIYIYICICLGHPKLLFIFFITIECALCDVANVCFFVCSPLQIINNLN